MKQDEMGGACSAHGRYEKCVQYLGWKTWRKEITWKILGIDGEIILDWILGNRVAQYRNQWQALVNLLMDLLVP